MAVKRTYETDGKTFIDKSTEKRHFLKLHTKSLQVTSKIYGFNKSVKHDELNEEMKGLYETIKADMHELTKCRDKFNLNISVSNAIQEKYYKKYSN